MGAPFLKYRLYDVLAGQGVTICPECQMQHQLGGETRELDDRELLAQLDTAWTKICDLLDIGGADLTTPPE